MNTAQWEYGQLKVDTFYESPLLEIEGKTERKEGSLMV